MKDPPIEPEGTHKIRKWLDEHGHDQSWLARRLGVTPQAVCNWLAGRGRPSLDNILEMDRLGIAKPKDWARES